MITVYWQPTPKDVEHVKQLVHIVARRGINPEFAQQTTHAPEGKTSVAFEIAGLGIVRRGGVKRARAKLEQVARELVAYLTVHRVQADYTYRYLPM